MKSLFLRNKLGLILLLWATNFVVLAAQQLPYYTQFRQFQQVINPASVNSDFFLYEYNITLNIASRLQWIDHNETPRTSFFSGEYISNFGNNFELVTGATLLQDRTGPLSSTGSYARIGSMLTSDPYFGALSIGFGVGYINYRLNADIIAWKDLDDPNIPLLNFSYNRPEISTGIYYYKRIQEGFLDGDNIYAGLSAIRLLDITKASDIERTSTIQPVGHYYGNLGWYHFFNEEAFLETSLWAKYTKGSPVNIDFNARFQPIRTFWFGGGFNFNGAVHLETGVNVPNFLLNNANFKIGYAFNHSIAAFGLDLGTSHELNISLLLDSYR